MKKEIWKDVIGYEGRYQVSNLGRVKSLNYWNSKKPRIMKHSNKKNEYSRVTLCYNGIPKIYLLHRLLAIAFIPNVENKPCINHIDGNRCNNNISNLEWCTYSENNYHSYNFLGKVKEKGKDNPLSIETIQYDLNGKKLRSHGSSGMAVEWLKKNGWPKASKGAVRSAAIGDYNAAYGYKWSYNRKNLQTC